MNKNELEIEHRGYEDSEYCSIEADYDPDGYKITSLGIEFISICEEKKRVDNISLAQY